MGISNLESRIVKLENTAKTEFGTPVSAVFFPVRKLMLAEERSHDEDGVAFPVLVATWDKPAGVLLPDSIRLIHNDTTVSLPGTATSYRMTGYAVDATVSVKVTAIYAQGNSSTIIAEKTISGDIEPPSVPTNLTVTGGFRTLTLRWENPTAEDFSHVEIWESITDNNIATAERIAQAYGTEFVRSNCAVLETRWYWIRAIDTHGNFSDFTSVASGTTNAIQASDIPINTITESMLIDALEQKINDSDAAIQIVEDVRMGEVNVFRQATAPTEGMITGDLWIDNTEVVHRYEGGEWVSKEGTPVYDLLKTAIAQYVVKTQAATGDGQLKVAGFGLYNDSTTGSEFAVLADKFYVYAQKEDGSSYSNIQVFTVDTTTTPPTVGINGNLIVDGSITGDKLNAASGITLADGGKLIIGEDGVIQIGDGAIVLDGATGQLSSTDPEDVSTGDRLIISYGALQFLRYNQTEAAYEAYESIKAVAAGTCTSNEWVELPGVWLEPPTILVSPSLVMSYDSAYPTSDQYWSFYVKAVEETSPGSGVWRFLPIASLRIGDGREEHEAGFMRTILSSERLNSVVTVESDVKTTPAGTTSIQLIGRMTSFAGMHVDDFHDSLLQYKGTATLYYKKTTDSTYTQGETATLYFPVSTAGVIKTWSLSALDLPSGTYNIKVSLSMYRDVDSLVRVAYASRPAFMSFDVFYAETLVDAMIRHGKLNWLAVAK